MIKKAAAPPVGSGRISVSATEAQNEFGRLLDTVAQDRVVVITRHNTPKAVMMSVDRYEALAGTDSDILERLTAEFDAMLERMQTPESVAATNRFLTARPEEIRAAAIAAARDRAG